MLLAALYCIRCTVRTLLEVLLVLLDVARPLARDVRIRENRLDGALGLTRTTIDDLAAGRFETPLEPCRRLDALRRDPFPIARRYRGSARRWYPGSPCETP